MYGRLLVLVVAMVYGTSRSSTLHATVPPDVKARVQQHIAAMPDSRVKVMLSTALSYLGVPYRWGGEDQTLDGGFDCVGIVYRLFHDHALEFPKARFSSLNMTPKPRGPEIPKLWWTEYTSDFSKVMKSCDGEKPEDGDVYVYHAQSQGKIIDRTGHVVIAVDAQRGYAISAARSAVRLHALGDFKTYDGKQQTACWRAPSGKREPYKRPAIAWNIGLQKGRGDRGSPFVVTNPVEFTFAAQGAESLTIEVTGRVLTLIGAVSPDVTELPPVNNERRFRLVHDFKKVDLPVDPGEHIGTPLRKMIIRAIDRDGVVAGERAFYIRLSPYWH